MSPGTEAPTGARDGARGPYTERQVHCLEAMGLTPWASRSAPADAAGRSPEQAQAVPLAPGSDHEPTLSARRVRAFERRGERVFETRPEAARALVLVEPAPGAPPSDGASGPPPLDGEPAALFRLMLRSIGLTPDDVSLGALAAPGEEGHAPTVRELLGGARRTVLWLTHDVDRAGAVDADGDAALRALGVAAFRVPHPALLLRLPLAKREAWAALKGVRRRLDEASPGIAGGSADGTAR